MKKLCVMLCAAMLLSGCSLIKKKDKEKEPDKTPEPKVTEKTELSPVPEETPVPSTPTPEPTPSAYSTMTPEPSPTPTPDATPTPVPAASADPEKITGAVGWVEVLVDDLNIRSNPGTDGSIVGGTQIKTKLHVFADPVKNNGYTWYKIAQNEEKWIADQDGKWLSYHAYEQSTPASSAVTPISGDPVYSEGTYGWVQVKVDDLNIRSKTGTDGKILGQVKNGAKYYVYAAPVTSGGYTWYKIAQNEEKWIADNGSWVSYTKFN